MKQSRFAYLDIYRFLAMIMVMWGHLVGTGMNAYEIPGVIFETMESPIIAAGGLLEQPESFLYYQLHTQMAVCGVVMFFICTGYLISGMSQRYSRRDFLINRFFRVYPTLVFAVILWCGIVAVSQKLFFSSKCIFGTVTLLYPWIGSGAAMDVLWTLVVEVLFYIIVLCYGKIDKYMVMLIYTVEFFAMLMYREFGGTYFYILADYFRFICLIALGCAIYLVEQDEKLCNRGKCVIILSITALNIVVFRYLEANGFETGTTYQNAATHLIPLILFVVLKHIPGKLLEKIPKFVYSLSQLVYPVYLLHVCVGLTSMYWLSRLGLNRYIVLAGGVTLSFACGKLTAVVIEEPAVRFSKTLIRKMESSSQKRK